MLAMASVSSLVEIGADRNYVATIDGSVAGYCHGNTRRANDE